MTSAALKEARAEIRRLRQDVSDMMSAPCVAFIRCRGCNRLHAKGWIGPDPKCEVCK